MGTILLPDPIPAAHSKPLLCMALLLLSGHRVAGDRAYQAGQVAGAGAVSDVMLMEAAAAGFPAAALLLCWACFADCSRLWCCTVHAPGCREAGTWHCRRAAAGLTAARLRICVSSWCSTPRCVQSASRRSMRAMIGSLPRLQTYHTTLPRCWRHCC